MGIRMGLPRPGPCCPLPLRAAPAAPRSDEFFFKNSAGGGDGVRLRRGSRRAQVADIPLFRHNKNYVNVSNVLIFFVPLSLKVNDLMN